MGETFLSGGGPGALAIVALALYGLFAMLSEVVSLLRRIGSETAQVSFSVLVLIHNQAEQIEGLVRFLTAQQWSRRTAWDLLLVDLDSDDDTLLIVERLALQFQQIRIVRLRESQAATACDTAMFLCRTNVALCLDLRRPVSADMIQRTLASIW